MRIVVSSCLLGEKCKYNGGDNCCEELLRLLKMHEVVSVCPEVLGGLLIPRENCEIVNGVVRTQTGESKDREYHSGAQKALALALENDVQLAVLQARSPSCGVHHIYDGTFSKTLIDGKGVFAQFLDQAGILSYDTEDLDNLRLILRNKKTDRKTIAKK